LAYTPELSGYHSATLRRVAWALGKPMTKVINSIFDNIDAFIDSSEVCERCKDRSWCESCYFRTGKLINEELPIDPIRLAPIASRAESDGGDDLSAKQAGIHTEVEMKVNQVSVLVSKKIGKNFCSWSLSYGATAEVEDEHFTEAISQLDTQLKEMVSESLPTPNGNGQANHHQLSE